MQKDPAPTFAAFLGGVYAWRSALALWEAQVAPYSGVATTLSVALSLAGFACFIAAFAPSYRQKLFVRSLPIFALILCLFATVYSSEIIAERLPFELTNDAFAYCDRAARAVLGGQNPYRIDLAEGLAEHRIPLEYQTPLADGSLTTRFAYPPGAFLLLIPFVAMGLGRWVYLLALLVALLAIVARKRGEGLVYVAGILLFQSILGDAIHGVTDTLWISLVVLALGFEKRPVVAGVLLGVACATKQQAWFLLPFLFVHFRERRSHLRQLSASAMIAFSAIILPFLLASPAAFLRGIAEPFRAPMVPFGEGLVALRMGGWIPLEKVDGSLLFLTTYVTLLVVAAVRPQTTSGVALLFPALAAFFGPRALHSYWEFHLLLVAATPGIARARNGIPRKIPQVALLAAPLLGGAVLAHRAFRPKDIRVEASPQRIAFGSRVVGISVSVTNESSKPITPAFWVHGPLQPFLWRANGPSMVPPHQTGIFQLTAPRPGREFDLVVGSKLFLRGKEGNDFASVSLDGRPPTMPGMIPNDDFSVWDLGATIPREYRWDGEAFPSHYSPEGLVLSGPEAPLAPRPFSLATEAIYLGRPLRVRMPDRGCGDFVLEVEAGGARRRWSTAAIEASVRGAGIGGSFRVIDVGAAFGEDAEFFQRDTRAIVDVPFRALTLRLRGTASGSCVVGGVRASGAEDGAALRGALTKHPGLMRAWEAAYAFSEGAGEHGIELAREALSEAEDDVPGDFLTSDVAHNAPNYLGQVLGVVRKQSAIQSRYFAEYLINRNEQVLGSGASRGRDEELADADARFTELMKLDSSRGPRWEDLRSAGFCGRARVAAANGECEQALQFLKECRQMVQLPGCSDGAH